MNWYIGQDIVAIRSHYDGFCKKGTVYTIRGLQSSPCRCNRIVIDIGASALSHIDVSLLACDKCGTRSIPNPSLIVWLGETFFAPLDNLVNMDEIKEVMEQTDLIPA
jgi:hypothetical protein